MPNRHARRAAPSSALLGAMALIACGGGERPEADTGVASSSAAPEAATPAPATAAGGTTGPAAVTVTPRQLAALRWLEGRWRGSDSAQLMFFEEYRFVDDSTIAMRGFADSTFGRANDSSRIELRGGRLQNVGGSATWVATRLDSTSAEFAALPSGSNRFVWTRAPGGWTARIISSGTTRLYHMRPITR